MDFMLVLYLISLEADLCHTERYISPKYVESSTFLVTVIANHSRVMPQVVVQRDLHVHMLIVL